MFDHSVTPLVPFPEVVDAEYNADGTITLIVNAVSEKDESGRLFTHKVTIKEKENDGFEYVSNDVLTMGKRGYIGTETGFLIKSGRSTTEIRPSQ